MTVATVLPFVPAQWFTVYTAAVNPTGKYRGMYQFDEELKDGTTYHIIEWLGTWHSQPRKYAAWLRKTPMNLWPEEVQTAAFVAVLDGK